MTGYSVVQAFKAAAEKADSLDGKKVAAALETFKDQPLLIGPTTFSTDLHIDLTRPILIMEVQDGKTSVVESYKLAQPPKVTF